MLTITIGVTCAVAVLVSMLAMGTGARRQAMGDVRDDRVVVNSHGARGIESSIPRDEADTVADLPGIRKRQRRQAASSMFQTVVPIEARRRVTGARIFFPLVRHHRGTAERYTEPDLHLTEGRMFRPGLHELIASNSCARQFTGFGLGDKRSMRGIDWTIVGHFSRETPAVRRAHGRRDSHVHLPATKLHSGTATLKSPRITPAFNAHSRANPTLHLEVLPRARVAEEGIKQFNGLLNFAATSSARSWRSGRRSVR